MPLGVALPVDLEVHEGFEAHLAAVGGRPIRAPPRAVPSASRRTGTTGWMVMWIKSPSRLSAMLTESTRNGMSSVTTSTTVWVDCQPCCSTCGL